MRQSECSLMFGLREKAGDNSKSVVFKIIENDISVSDIRLSLCKLYDCLSTFLYT